MKKIKLLVFFLIFFLCALEIFATAQYPDKIIYNGKEYMLHSNPLEPYFEKFPGKRPKSGVMSSALWRGYVATFEIADEKLVLKDIEIQVPKKSGESFETEWKSALSTVFPGNRKTVIDWFLGLLVIPNGEIVNYVHMGYGSTYENYILLEIAAGNFIKAKEFDYKEYEKFKEKQFEAFKKTEEYRKIVEELKKRDDYSAEFIDSFLKNFVTNYTSKILVD